NDTSDTATNFGSLAAGSTLIDSLSIGNHANGLPDYDWYRFTASQAGTVTATITIGNIAGDLEVHLFTVNSNNTLVELAKSAVRNAPSQSVSAAFSAGEVILVEVKGIELAPGVFDQATYSLTMSLG